MSAFAPSLQAAPLTFGQFFDETAIGTQLGNGPFTVGWSFHLTAPITITNLGVYHDEFALLMEPHFVGIWNAAGALEVQQIVTSHNPCVLDQGGNQQWCIAPVNPITLRVGTYTIGATWDNALDPMIFPGTLAGLGLKNFNGPDVVFIQNEFIAGPPNLSDGAD